tara:strand:+ start:307 stop:2253 length:1947 start_codon:yes stop_codon:yes gene_type:complete
LKYRAEIDGLRALAVVPVILFHAGFELFSGGFVGVDVFFVISGYLITTILIEDIENKQFSIVNFYERRARRILPALFFVMLVCIPFAWVLMLPNQMKDFSQSLVAVSLFASNIIFWKKSAYFDAVGEEKPLLHTWSLAVEEQYYLLFPIFLILVWRFGKSRVFWMIVVIAAISLVLSEWGWRNKANANFYFTPTRAWELFAGSIAAFIVQKNGVKKNNFLALLGLSAIVFSIFFYDEKTPFPSVYALAPVVGVVLVILYADKKTLVAKLLSMKVFVGFGLISYSAYLWHHPLFTFAKIVWLDLHGILAMAFVCLSLLLAYFSWFFVETPFRNKSRFGKPVIFSLSLVGILFFTIIGFFGNMTNGYEGRQEWNDHYYLTMSAQELFNDDCITQYPNLASFHTCRISSSNPPTIALVGDSHSHVLYEALADKYQNETIINIGRSSCLPFVNDEHLKRRKNCKFYQAELNSFLSSNQQIHTIILAGYWGYLSSGDLRYTDKNYRIHNEISATDEETFLQNASNFLSHHKSNVQNILLIEDAPDLDFDPIRCDEIGLFRFMQSSCIMRYDNFQPRKQQIDSVISNLLDQNVGVNYIQVEHLFCGADNCLSKSEQGTLYADSNHVSRLGAELIIGELAKLLNRLLQLKLEEVK